MKTTFLTLVTTLVTIAVPAAQNAQQLFDAAQKLKPARVTSVERIAPTTEPGTPFVVHATLLDPAGKPAGGIHVFAYQTDRTGIYAAPGAADPWRLKGWAVTDAQGRFEFQTIRPGSYPEGGVPAHIHLSSKVQSRSSRRGSIDAARRAGKYAAIATVRTAASV